MPICNVSDLQGLILDEARQIGDEAIVFRSGETEWLMRHDQDCCETVYLEDVAGDLRDLVGVPILMAQEISNLSDKEMNNLPKYNSESETWTFYKFATIKGYVTLRWYGSSNGYYSEGVSFRKIK